MVIAAEVVVVVVPESGATEVAVCSHLVQIVEVCVIKTVETETVVSRWVELPVVWVRVTGQTVVDVSILKRISGIPSIWKDILTQQW